MFVNEHVTLTSVVMGLNLALGSIKINIFGFCKLLKGNV